MDDLTGKISEILSNPGAMEQIKNLAGMIGNQTQNSSGESSPVNTPSANLSAPSSEQGPDLSALGSILNALKNTSAPQTNFANTDPSPAPGNNSPANGSSTLGNLSGLSNLLGGLSTGGGSDLIGMLAKMGPIFSALRQEDDSTRLLHALRPMLRPARQKKLDEALKLLHLMRALPLLKQSGILGSLGGLL